MTILERSDAIGPSTPTPGRVGLLDPLRRRWGLALLCTAAVLASVSSLYFGASSPTNPDVDWQAGMYLYAAPWACLAATAFCGSFWARPATGAPAADRVVLVAGGVAALIVSLTSVATTLATVYYWSDAVFNAIQVATAVADLTVGILILVLAARYAKHRTTPGGHTPMGPLIVAGITYMGFVYGDVYYATWFDDSPFNIAFAATLVGVAFGGIGLALLLAALLRLGPVYRLLVGGAALIVVGVVEESPAASTSGRASPVCSGLRKRSRTSSSPVYCWVPRFSPRRAGPRPRGHYREEERQIALPLAAACRHHLRRRDGLRRCGSLARRHL